MSTDAGESFYLGGLGRMDEPANMTVAQAEAALARAREQDRKRRELVERRDREAKERQAEAAKALEERRAAQAAERRGRVEHRLKGQFLANGGTAAEWAEVGPAMVRDAIQAEATERDRAGRAAHFRLTQRTF